MFGLKFKSPYRKYAYYRLSEKDQTTCTIYKCQYNPVLEVSGFGTIGIILYHVLLYISKFNYNANIMFVIFMIFVIIRTFMITEKDKTKEGD